MYIVDDITTNNLTNIVSYNNGVEYVRNLIILDSTTAGSGQAYFWQSSVSSVMQCDVVVGATTLSYSGDWETISTAMFADANLLQAGIIAEPYAATETRTYVKLTSKEIDYKTVQVHLYGDINTTLYFWGGGDVSVTNTTMSEHWGLSGSTYYRLTEELFGVLKPRDGLGAVVAKDEDSILRYGTRLESLDALSSDLVDTEAEKLVNNKLEELKDPKARIIIDVPFGSIRKYLDIVEIRLSYENQGQFRTFKEGGHFKAWADSGTYRYKQFYIVGITHNKEGTYTRVRLMEKLN